ncbi:MAG TPA: hypothetical protein VLC71_02295 [Thermomonas sp.]|nr:hypothetical protein [Thermomonas sp.]
MQVARGVAAAPGVEPDHAVGKQVRRHRRVEELHQLFEFRPMRIARGDRRELDEGHPLDFALLPSVVDRGFAIAYHAAHVVV